MAVLGASIQGVRKEKSVLEASLHGMISSLKYTEENEEWIKGALEVFNRE